MSTAEVLNVTNSEYHAATDRVSHSAKECFRRSREAYRAQYIDKTIPWPEPTEAMLLGTAIHAALLEPEWFATNYVASAKFDRRTNAGKAAAAEYAEQNAGKIIMDIEAWLTVNAVREAAMANRIVRTILEETPPEMREHTLAWDCPETGVPCKCRRDINHPNMQADLKSLAIPMSASAVARRVAEFGYQRQGAFYRVGEKMFTGDDKPFVFIFLGTKPPYSVGVFDIDADDLEFAHKQNMETLAEMERCRAYPLLYTPAYATEIQTLCLPKWTRYEDDYGF